MALKKYTVTQKVNLDGSTVSRSIGITGSLTDVQILTGMLEGEITAKVDEPALAGGSDASVSSATANFVDTIKVGYKTDEGDYLNKYISSYDYGDMIFNSSSDRETIEAALLNVQMVAALPTLKPTKVDANMRATYAPASV